MGHHGDVALFGMVEVLLSVFWTLFTKRARNDVVIMSCSPNPLETRLVLDRNGLQAIPTMSFLHARLKRGCYPRLY